MKWQRFRDGWAIGADDNIMALRRPSPYPLSDRGHSYAVMAKCIDGLRVPYWHVVAELYPGSCRTTEHELLVRLLDAVEEAR